MKKIIFVLISLLFIIGCTPKVLTEQQINDAIEDGTIGLNPLENEINSPTCEEKQQPYCNYSEQITIRTPYYSIAQGAAWYSQFRTRKMKEYLQERIQSASLDFLDIEGYIEGSSSEELSNTKAIIKYEDKQLNSTGTIDKSTHDCIDPVTHNDVPNCKSSEGFFRFEHLSSFKDKKIKFILIRERGEKEYDIDMSKYK